MIEIIEGADEAAIRAIVAQPDVWRWVSDDDVPEDWTLPNRHYLMLRKDGEAVGFFAFSEGTDALSLHVAMRPDFRGACVIDAGRKAIAWARSKFHGKRIFAMVPLVNIRAIAAAKCCGFVHTRIPAPPWLRDGKRYPRIVMEVP